MRSLGSRLAYWGLLAALLLSGHAASADGVGLQIKAPDEGQVVGERITVRGSVETELDGALLRVNGTPAVLRQGTFEVVIEAKQDGPFKVRVVYAAVGLPATTVERGVVVDRTPPALEITAPAAEASTSPTDEVVVRGVVLDRNLLHLRMNGQDIPVPPDGRFEASFLLPEKGETRIVIEAIDRAGNRSQAVRTVRFDPAAAPEKPAGTPPPTPPGGTPPGTPPAPPEKPPEPLAFAHRLKRARGLSLGETLTSQNAVTHGLRWLRGHQSPDGRWEATEFDKWCDGKPNTGDKPDGAGKRMYDVGVTGLALCAFLAAGYVDRGEHEFVEPVVKGLAYLVRAQDAEGRYGETTMQHYNYNHAAATLAMVEAYGMTGSPAYLASAQKALGYITLARNPYFVWRYGVKPGDNDTSVTGWMMLPLKSAMVVNEEAVKRRMAPPLVIDPEAFDGIRAWLDKMTDPDYGRVGYISRGQGPARPVELRERFPNERSEYPTAVGMLARLFMNDPKKSAPIVKGTALCMDLLPTWNRTDGSIDFPFWYFGALVFFQIGGTPWQRWNTALQAALVHNQRMEGSYCAFKGSCDPEDVWSMEGGRVYATAMFCLMLATPNRYEKIVPRK